METFIHFIGTGKQLVWTVDTVEKVLICSNRRFQIYSVVFYAFIKFSVYKVHHHRSHIDILPFVHEQRLTWQMLIEHILFTKIWAGFWSNGDKANKMNEQWESRWIDRDVLYTLCIFIYMHITHIVLK